MQIANLDLLENAQFTPEQARALLQVMDNSAKEQGHLTATKGDLDKVRGELKADIEKAKGELETKIEQVKGDLTTAVERSANRLIMWFVPLTIGSAGIVALITRLMLHQ